MRKILNASECLTVKRNEALRRKLKEIMWEAIPELEKLVYPIAVTLQAAHRNLVLNCSELRRCEVVEKLGQYFDELFANLSTDQEVSLSYLTQPATMKLLEIRKVVPKR